MNKPYIFYFQTPYGLVEFPITPGEVTISNGSNNDVITLITEGDVNILKSPSLIEVEFEARFPTHKYPYSIDPDRILSYHEIFTKLKEEKKPFKFIIARSGWAEKSTGNTNLLMALEDLETKESADEGDDVIYTFKLKQYKEYGVVTLPASTMPETTSTARKHRNSNKDDSQKEYIVQKGDCLWLIAKKFYGNGAKWPVIYSANKSIIEETARSHGLQSSSNGHWIFPGTKLIIPNATTANKTNTKTTAKKSSSKTDDKSVNWSSDDMKNMKAAFDYDEYFKKGKGYLIKGTGGAGAGIGGPKAHQYQDLN